MNILRTLLVLATFGAACVCGASSVSAADIDRPPSVEPTAYTVHFGFGKTDISASTMQILWEAGHTNAALGRGVIRVTGYADGKGAAAANQKVSLRRAQAVASQLAKIGLDPARMVISGLGAKSGNGKAADRRRVEIVFEPEPQPRTGASLAPDHRVSAAAAIAVTDAVAAVGVPPGLTAPSPAGTVAIGCDMDASVKTVCVGRPPVRAGPSAQI